MRILIDLQGAQNDSRDRGIGRYSLAFARALARNAGQHRVEIILNGLFPETLAPIRAAFSGYLSDEQFVTFSAPGPVAELRGENTWRRRTAELLREYLIEAIAPDALLITSMVEGAQDDTVTSIGRLRSNVPVAAIIYDLIPMIRPDDYGRDEPAKRWYQSKIDSLRRADHLLAISDASRQTAIELLNVEPPKITNILSAAECSFSTTQTPHPNALAVAKQYGIHRKFLMHSSAFEVRKNFHGLIAAYALLPGQLRADYQLVLVCKLDLASREGLLTLAKTLGLTPGEMVLTGFVPDDDLIALYSACYLFVFPSLFEGFGLPPLEAMCCGAPAIGSDVSSVPEVIGRDDALFDPNSPENIAAVILKVLTNPDFYNSLKAHAKIQAAKFSWDSTALRALGAIERMVSDGHSLPARSSTAAKRRHLLDKLGEASKGFSPDDLEILDLARCIDANDLAAKRLLSVYGAT